MTNYADFSYYSGTYKGAVIDTASFDYYSMKSSQLIRIKTLGNINETLPIPDDAKMCCCDVAEILYKQDKSKRSGITSEKVGEYSVSYTDEEKTKALVDTDIDKSINNWLLMTGLLYRGCY